MPVDVALFSARGVSGEAAGLSATHASVQRHGGHVPHYDVYGYQHHRNPYRDKSSHVHVPERADWSRVPEHATQSELHAARRAAKHPHISYDIDGDGAVGPTDYFIAKQFSLEQDHRLNTGERNRCVDALESGLLDHYSFGHEQAGAGRQFPVVQKRGKIISVDNVNDLAETFPRHHNAHKDPRFPTKTDMEMQRKAHLANSSSVLKDEWDKQYPYMVPEPPVTQEKLVEHPQFSHIRERKEGYRKEAREYAGLEFDNTHLNPARESQQPGLGHRERPDHNTRTGLNEHRKSKHRENLVNSRRVGEEDYIPSHGKRTIHDHNEYELRRPDPDAMTMTKLQDMRRQDRIEHNMTNFSRPQPEHPRYCEHKEPWYEQQRGYVADAPQTCLLKQIREPEVEVAGKVTGHNPFPRTRELEATVPDYSDLPANSVTVQHDQLGSRTVNRWSSEFVPVGLQSAVPRLFDGIKQAQTFSTDTADLEDFSSFDCIAKNKLGKDRERQRLAAKYDQERATSWKKSTRTPLENNLADRSVQSVGSSRMSASVPRVVAGGGTRPVGAAFTPLPAPSGDDPPMTERLGRLAGRWKGEENSKSGETPRRISAGSATSPTKQVRRTGSVTPGAAPRGIDATQGTPRGGTVVRSAGFQWVGRNALRGGAADGRAASIGQPTPSGSQKALSQA